MNYANPYGQNWFDNSTYSPRSYTSGYSNFQPPPLGTPGYTNWLSSDYNAQYPWRFGSGPPIQLPEPEPIDIPSDSGKWESQVLTDEDGNKLKGSLEYDRSDGFFKMTGSTLPLGEGYITAFQYTPTNGSAPISFQAGFDSGHTAIFTGTAKNTMATEGFGCLSWTQFIECINTFVVDGEYVIKDNAGRIADRGTFNM